MTTTEHAGIGEEMSEKIIHYSEIPQFADSAERNKRYQILLSKFQAKLYRKKIEHDLSPLGKVPAFLDTVLYVWRLAIMVLFCRNLLLLGYFHEFDRKSLKAMEFKDYEGKVLLTLNPDKPT